MKLDQKYLNSQAKTTLHERAPKSSKRGFQMLDDKVVVDHEGFYAATVGWGTWPTMYIVG